MEYHERVEFRVLDRPTAHSLSFALRFSVLPMMAPFEWRLTAAWAKFGAPGATEYAIALLPLSSASNHADHSVDSNLGSILQLCLLKPGTRPDTTVFTYLFQINLGSQVNVLERFLPNVRIEAIRMHRALVASFKRHFASHLQAWLNDVEDDSAWRDAMVAEMRNSDHVYTEEETALIAIGMAQLDAFASRTGKALSPRHCTTVEMAEAKLDEASDVVFGHVEANVRASLEHIVAYLMHFDGKHLESQLNPEVDVVNKVLEVSSPHHSVVFVEKKFAPLKSRTLLLSLLWQKVCDAPLTYVWATVPIEHHVRVPLVRDAVSADVTTCIRLTQMPNGVTRITYSCSADMKVHLPQRLAKKVVVHLMQMAYDVQRYFLQVEPPTSATTADGVILAHLIMDLADTTEQPERAAAIQMFVRHTAVLRECGFTHLHAFIHGIFDERLLFTLGVGFRNLKTVSIPEVVATNPAVVTERGAALMGRGLESILRISSTPAEAIGDLLRKYPALKVMADRHVWFQPLLETIAKRRVAVATLGLRFRLAVGAALTYLDMASDIKNIQEMLLVGRSMGAFVLLGTIALNLAFQAFIVILQNSHLGRRAVLRELIVVFSLLKPGIDAIRVAGGTERVEGAPLDPFTEMTMCKLSEMTFESIPGGLTQAIVLLNGGDWTTAAVVSVCLSCVSTAFIATTLVHEVDTDPTKRTKNPEFYGYLPDDSGKRALAFALLFLYHTVWTLGKTFSMALLAQTNWLWLVVYLLSDHCGLILYKLARGDLI
jgi:hypothetical protein